MNAPDTIEVKVMQTFGRRDQDLNVGLFVEAELVRRELVDLVGQRIGDEVLEKG